jgi:hypothetical protein
MIQDMIDIDNNNIIFRPRCPEYAIDYWTLGYFPTFSYIESTEDESMITTEFINGFIEACNNSELTYQGHEIKDGSI